MQRLFTIIPEHLLRIWATISFNNRKLNNHTSTFCKYNSILSLGKKTANLKWIQSYIQYPLSIHLGKRLGMWVVLRVTTWRRILHYNLPCIYATYAGQKVVDSFVPQFLVVYIRSLLQSKNSSSNPKAMKLLKKGTK